MPIHSENESLPEVGRAIKKLFQEAARTGRLRPSKYQIWKEVEGIRQRAHSKTKKDAKERDPSLDRARLVERVLERLRWNHG